MSDPNASSHGPSTLAIHAGSYLDEATGGACSPIFTSTAFAYPNATNTNIYPRYFNTPNQLVINRKLAALEKGERVVRTRYGVDDETCTGDHSCIRLSGCPTLTVKTAGDPLKRSPVAHVQNECVGCGLCGEVAHAAVLCPSFYRAEVITHPSWWERLADRINRVVIGWLQPA